MTNWTNVTSMDSLLLESNRYAPFWSGVLLMLWVVLIITFMPLGTTIALISGSFLAGLMGLFLVYMGVVAWKWVLALFTIVVALVIWETLFARKEN